MSNTTWHSRLALPVSPERDHIWGPVNAPVTLIEYGDYQCPFCAVAHSVVKAVEAQIGDQMRFVFRHFPMTTVHPDAENAAEAAEAAGAQRRYWAMHDTLYNNYQALEGRQLISYAAALGLDVEQFMADVAAHAYASKVSEDFMSGVRSGVNGTPSFFINGVRHDGSWEFPSLLAAVQSAAMAVGV